MESALCSNKYTVIFIKEIHYRIAWGRPCLHAIKKIVNSFGPDKFSGAKTNIEYLFDWIDKTKWIKQVREQMSPSGLKSGFISKMLGKSKLA